MIQSRLLLDYREIDHVFIGRSTAGMPQRYTQCIDRAATAQQIHGNGIATVDQFSMQYAAVDGLVSSKRGTLLIKTADCLPILLFDPDKQVIAAIHAGWRGLHEDIILAAITRFRQLGSVPRDVLTVIGPHIRRCCYRVRSERIDQFRQRGFARNTIVRESEELVYLDLTAIAMEQLRAAGITEKHIDALSVCTHCDGQFCSYRRDGKQAGRNRTIITLR